MNRFERELLIFTEIFEDKKFIGNAVYISLGENNRLKIEFVDSQVKHYYDKLKLTVIDKNKGAIDRAYIKFEDEWNVRNEKAYHKAPHLWVNDGKIEWHGYKPNPRDYELITEKIDNYYELFAEEQTQGFEMTQSM